MDIRRTVRNDEIKVNTRYGLVAKDNDLSNVDMLDIIDTLGKYEDTGMTPSEIIKTKEAIRLFYKDFPKNIGRATDMLPLSLFESEDRITNTTNADKIRNMNDENLANMIVSGELAAICPECAYYGTSDCYINTIPRYGKKDCAKGILKWLKSEVN